MAVVFSCECVCVCVCVYVCEREREREREIANPPVLFLEDEFAESLRRTSAVTRVVSAQTKVLVSSLDHETDSIVGRQRKGEEPAAPGLAQLGRRPLPLERPLLPRRSHDLGRAICLSVCLSVCLSFRLSERLSEPLFSRCCFCPRSEDTDGLSPSQARLYRRPASLQRGGGGEDRNAEVDARPSSGSLVTA